MASTAAPLAALAQESFWVNKYLFEDAERRLHEQLAKVPHYPILCL